jgi:IAA-amino acid hydrolase
MTEKSVTNKNHDSDEVFSWVSSKGTPAFISSRAAERSAMVRRRRRDGVVAMRWFVALLALTRPAPGTGSESDFGSALRDIASDAALESDYVVAIRRELHRAPELMWEEFGTSALVKRELDSMGIEHTDVASPGVVGVIGTGGSPAVLLRADMDALPVLEESDASFFPDALKSRNEGIMHACGHDGHVAMLLGAAKLLKRRESSLNGTVYLAFQPAEEGGAGAARMLENGLVKMTPLIDAAFALHNWPYPETPSGTVGTRAGTIMAGSAAFEIVIASSASAANAVACAAGVVEALQTVSSRRVDPLQPALVTIAAVETLDETTKTKHKTVRLLGQFHATDPVIFASLFASVESVAAGAAATNGCACAVDFAPEAARTRAGESIRRVHYPPTVNDARVTDLVVRVGREMFGAEAVSDDVAPVMPGEDFGFFAQTWPSAMAWLGAHAPERGAAFPLHSGKYVLDESVLHLGVAMHAGVAARFLGENGF